MGILTSLIAAACHLVVIALDIGILFCLVRILSGRLSWDILEALDQVGKPIVQRVTEYGTSWLARITGDTPDEGPALAAGTAGLLAARFLLVLLFNSVLAT